MSLWDLTKQTAGLQAPPGYEAKVVTVNRGGKEFKSTRYFRIGQPAAVAEKPAPVEDAWGKDQYRPYRLQYHAGALGLAPEDIEGISEAEIEAEMSRLDAEQKVKEPDVEAVMLDFLRQFRHEPKEHCIAVSAGGKVIFQKRGSKNKVTFTGIECAQMNGCDTFVHNHPDMYDSGESGCFSIEDILFGQHIRARRLVVYTPSTKYTWERQPDSQNIPDKRNIRFFINDRLFKMKCERYHRENGQYPTPQEQVRWINAIREEQFEELAKTLHYKFTKESLPEEPPLPDMPRITIKETAENRRVRVRRGYTKVALIDAKKFAQAYERTHYGQTLAWQPEKAKKLEGLESFDAYPLVSGIAGMAGVSDGRHRIAEAAKRGALIEVAYHPDYPLEGDYVLKQSVAAELKKSISFWSTRLMEVSHA